jgi:FkbM family methyltransferase
MASTVMNLLGGIAKKARSLVSDPGAEKGMGWLTVRKLKHYSTGPERIFHYKDKEIRYVNPWDLYWAFQEIFVSEIYKSQLPPNARVFDCGANIGLATLYLKQHHPDCRVIAFEPDEKNYDLLARNVGSWGYEGIEIRKQAVWKENTTLRFSSCGNMASKISGSEDGVAVEAIRLRDLLTEKVHFLKLDIEGAEYEVLKDIEDKLNMVDQMFFEYHGRFDETAHLSDVFSILSRAGFQYYIKLATDPYNSPFIIEKRQGDFDVQLNIFCFRNQSPPLA